MTRILMALVIFCAVVSVAFAVSVLPSLSFSDSHALGVAFTQFSGFLSIALMSFAMLLSARPRWMEPSLDGLDKMYRLHKWLGIGAIVLGTVHWLTKTGDGHRLPPAGSEQVPADTAAAAAGQIATSPEGLLQSLTGPAHMVAQPALFILIALGVIALIKVIPYRFFAKTHILTAFIFGVLVFHSIVLLKAAYWATPVGLVTLLLSAIGVVAGLYSILHYFGATPLAPGKILSSTYYPELKVLETELQVGTGWRGHKSGQFAFVTTSWREGAHPFTIATHWEPETRSIGFIAKELGDHTARLREIYTPGRSVSIEGPYGRFTFESSKPRQIWIGGGIGIAPFVARMRELAGRTGGKPIDLFHCTTEESSAALSKMRADAAASGITLHILVSPRDGLLTARSIVEAVPNWTSASVWFCGPAGFGTALRRDFVSAGLAGSDFHQELFEMR